MNASDNIRPFFLPHPFLCDKNMIDCSTTYSNRKGFCQNSSTRQECIDSENNYFCEKSSTCIPKGKLHVVLICLLNLQHPSIIKQKKLAMV